MPLQEKSKVELREEIAKLCIKGFTIKEVSERFNVNRETVRLWRDRYLAEGRPGLEERSRAPLTCPHRTSPEIEALIVAEKARWRYGAKKIRQRLIDAYPEIAFPSRAAFEAIFRRQGLPALIRKRLRAAGETPFARRYNATTPGELLTIDHKGQFRMRNGQYCYPLTMMDYVSRYLLACHALSGTSLTLAWPVIERVFREHGLPIACLSDNGPPFGAPGRGRISSMSVKLMKLNVQPVFIWPGCPWQNGVHERMHREFKAEATRPPATCLRTQQEVVDRFRYEYNVERPHEGIAMQRPATVFRKAVYRPYPRRPKRPEYESHFETRLVSATGTFKWNNESVYVGEALQGERIALEAMEGRVQQLYFHAFKVGVLDEESNLVS